MNAVSHHPIVRHLDLFSGIGGFALAARMVGGIETVGFCEINPYATKVLQKNFPGVPIHNDVKTLKPNEHGRIDLITGGYPCQPFSHAGERRGEEDDRHLWPEVRRIIEESRPRMVLCENVAGHITLGLDQVLSELDSLGYSCGATVLPACAVDASHRRDRVWILAHSRSSVPQDGCGQSGIPPKAQEDRKAAWDNGRSDTGARWASEDEYPVDGMAHGIPSRVDRLHGLGNAIVPQVAAEILRAMMRVDSLLPND
jgi:DNA (cytosine-5)-methyltransferase 1